MVELDRNFDPVDSKCGFRIWSQLFCKKLRDLGENLALYRENSCLQNAFLNVESTGERFSNVTIPKKVASKIKNRIWSQLGQFLCGFVRKQTVFLSDFALLFLKNYCNIFSVWCFRGSVGRAAHS